jgi:histidinol-phosphatase (PHP family)
MEKTPLISLHGGHSGEFCCHANDKLEEIICAYIQRGFKTVGITEHMPPASPKLVYPDEIKRGLTIQDLHERFARYTKEVNRLKTAYKSDIQIYLGMETETYSGFIPHIKQLIHKFKPDYIVGSVHHVNDIGFDYSKKEYERALFHCGSHEKLYLSYFDLQYEMIKALRPFVVGHFDLIRIHDENFEHHISTPLIQKRIDRNLFLIKELGLVMDYNLRPLARGEKAPYLCPPILKRIKDLGITVVPGDDSHGKDQAGKHIKEAVKVLKKMGFDTHWPIPKLLPPR